MEGPLIISVTRWHERTLETLLAKLIWVQDSTRSLLPGLGTGASDLCSDLRRRLMLLWQPLGLHCDFQPLLETSACLDFLITVIETCVDCLVPKSKNLAYLSIHSKYQEARKIHFYHSQSFRAFSAHLIVMSLLALEPSQSPGFLADLCWGHLNLEELYLVVLWSGLHQVMFGVQPPHSIYVPLWKRKNARDEGDRGGLEVKQGHFLSVIFIAPGALSYPGLDTSIDCTSHCGLHVCAFYLHHGWVVCLFVCGVRGDLFAFKFPLGLLLGFSTCTTPPLPATVLPFHSHF